MMADYADCANEALVGLKKDLDSLRGQNFISMLGPKQQGLVETSDSWLM